MFPFLLAETAFSTWVDPSLILPRKTHGCIWEQNLLLLFGLQIPIWQLPAQQVTVVPFSFALVSCPCPSRTGQWIALQVQGCGGCGRMLLPQLLPLPLTTKKQLQGKILILLVSSVCLWIFTKLPAVNQSKTNRWRHPSYVPFRSYVPRCHACSAQDQPACLHPEVQPGSLCMGSEEI